MTEKIHMSPTRAFKFAKNPLRALEDYTGESKWFEGDNTALLYGTIVHNLAEQADMLDGFTEDEKKVLLSSRGTSKGQLKAEFKEAEIVGNHLQDYVAKKWADNYKADFEVPLKEPNMFEIDGEDVEANITGRADMLTEYAVFDFKTVASNDFKGFLEYGSFRDNRQLQYMKQVAFYAHMFNKPLAHIIYIQKSKTTPFIYDYELTEKELYDGWNEVSQEIIDGIEVIVRGKKHAKAVNDGSIWAFKKFGGIIDGNQNDKI